MKRTFAAVPILLVILLSLTVSACSSYQTLSIGEDGSGEAEIRIVLEPYFAEYLSDLSAGFGNPDAPAFDLPSIEYAFSTYPELELRSLETVGVYELNLSVAFTSVEALLRDRNAVLADVLTFRRIGSDREVSAVLDRSAVARSLEFARIDSGITEILLPPVGDMSEAEYREYLVWAMEEYEDAETLDRSLQNVRIETKIDVDGTIVSTEGNSEPGAFYSVSLLHLLTTGKPETYRLRFRP